MTTGYPAEWLRGVLSLCVLGVLNGGPSYGYAITQRLDEAGLGAVKGGTLYPLLTRLEADGLVATSWQAGHGGPNRKYFQLTDAGRAELTSNRKLWRQFSELIVRLTHAAEGDLYA